MSFNPNEHMLDMRGKKYLPVAWRIVWFRETHPAGTIGTEVISFEPLCVKATITNAEGVLIATGHGTANDTGKAVWSGRAIEKAETAAIGRALGHAGFGTQFDVDDEDDNLADSPVENKRNPYSNAPKAPTSDEWNEATAIQFANRCKAQDLNPLKVLDLKERLSEWKGTATEAFAKLPAA